MPCLLPTDLVKHIMGFRQSESLRQAIERDDLFSYFRPDLSPQKAFTHPLRAFHILSKEAKQYTKRDLKAFLREEGIIRYTNGAKLDLLYTFVSHHYSKKGSLYI